MSPVVSVIIPIYNTEKYLPDCLDSVCAQTLRDIEIICVNDGSTDNSAAILAEYAQKDDRIRVITQKNAGELAARNTGITASSGKWLGFVDSDDAVEPEMYQRLLKNGIEYNADISHCGLMFCYPDGRRKPHYGTGLLKLQDHDEGMLDLLDGRQIEPSMCSKLYRAELFLDFNVTDRIEHNGDFYCNVLLFEKSKLSVYDDFCPYLYRQHYNLEQSVETMMGILSVRQKMIAMCSPSVRDAACRLWLSTLVNTLNRFSVSSDPEAPAAYHKCIDILKKNREKIPSLSRKQQIAAELHLKAPLAAKMVYRLYGKYSQYRYEH